MALGDNLAGGDHAGIPGVSVCMGDGSEAKAAAKYLTGPPTRRTVWQRPSEQFALKLRGFCQQKRKKGPGRAPSPFYRLNALLFPECPSMAVAAVLPAPMARNDRGCACDRVAAGVHALPGW